MKTIVIPTRLGYPTATFTINGIEYTYATGVTVSVEDAVADVIKNIEALEPKQGESSGGRLYKHFIENGDTDNKLIVISTSNTPVSTMSEVVSLFEGCVSAKHGTKFSTIVGKGNNYDFVYFNCFSNQYDSVSMYNFDGLVDTVTPL